MRRPSPSSSTTTSRLLLLLLLVAAAACACGLAVGACSAGGGVAEHGGGGRTPRPPSSSSLLVGSLQVAARGRDVLGGAVEQDYGYVDPTPDTRRRGGTAPIPHNLDGDRAGDDGP
ncbi:unnamed protein product [Urochloa humidicola]